MGRTGWDTSGRSCQDEAQPPGHHICQVNIAPQKRTWGMSGVVCSCSPVHQLTSFPTMCDMNCQGRTVVESRGGGPERVEWVVNDAYLYVVGAYGSEVQSDSSLEKGSRQGDGTMTCSRTKRDSPEHGCLSRQVCGVTTSTKTPMLSKYRERRNLRKDSRIALLWMEIRTDFVG